MICASHEVRQLLAPVSLNVSCHLSKSRTTTLGLYANAREFFRAAEAELHRSGKTVSFPAYYLLGHSIELVLKAFLLGRGTGLSELKSKKFGHNLSALLVEARRRKLGKEVRLSEMDIRMIGVLSADYAEKRFEYRETGFYRLPNLEHTKRICENLLDGLEAYCVRVHKRGRGN